MNTYKVAVNRPDYYHQKYIRNYMQECNSMYGLRYARSSEGLPNLPRKTVRCMGYVRLCRGVSKYAEQIDTLQEYFLL